MFKVIIKKGLMKFYHFIFPGLQENEQALRESKRELTIRNKIAHIFLTVPDDKMYGEVLSVILEALESKHGAFGYYREDGAMVLPSLTKDIWDKCQIPNKDIIFPREVWISNISGQAIKEKKGIYSNTTRQVPEGHIPIKRILIMPVIHQEKVIGIFWVANKASDYDDKDKNLLETIARAVAPILQARLQSDRHEKERKQAEEALLAEQQRLFSLLDGLPAFVLLFAPDLSIRFANHYFKEHFCNSGQKSCHEFMFGRKEPCENCHTLRVFDTQNPDQWECNSHIGKTYQIYDYPFTDIDGSPLVLELGIDITDRKQMENELLRAKEEAEANYWALIGQAQDGVIIMQDTLLKFANEAMAELTGFAVEEMMGNPFVDFVTEEYKELMAQRHKLRLKGEDVPAVYEIKLPAKEGAIKDVEVSAGVIQYKGKPASMAFMRDITDRKRMEEELQKAQKLESLELFAGGIAHDFKNHLATIIGSFYLIKSHLNPGGKDSQILYRAENAAKQATNLSQQLLAFAKGGKLIKKPASLSKLLKDTACLSVQSPQVKCEFSLFEDLWPVDIDRGQITQVINNLIINAVQAISEGGIIRICAENVMVEAKDNLPLPKGKYVKISVKDQGLGIPKEQLPKIFDPYFTTKKRGNGLGLASAYSIIKKHGGHITVESKVGAGTTFFIYLPASSKELFEIKDVKEGLLVDPAEINIGK